MRFLSVKHSAPARAVFADVKAADSDEDALRISDGMTLNENWRGRYAHADCVNEPTRSICSRWLTGCAVHTAAGRDVCDFPCGNMVPLAVRRTDDWPRIEGGNWAVCDQSGRHAARRPYGIRRGELEFRIVRLNRY